MKTVYGKFSTSYEFEDSDKRYGLFNQLIMLKNQGQITESDFDIIASMYPLHQKLPALEHVLFLQGFILPVNDKGLDSQKATWIYEKKGDLKRVVNHVYDSFETMWNRSDRFSFTTTYEAGEVTASEEFGHSERDYGRIVETHKYFTVKIKGKVVIEDKEEKKE